MTNHSRCNHLRFYSIPFRDWQGQSCCWRCSRQSKRDLATAIAARYYYLLEHNRDTPRWTNVHYPQHEQLAQQHGLSLKAFEAALDPLVGVGTDALEALYVKNRPLYDTLGLI
jgi:hypothetical protein